MAVSSIAPFDSDKEINCTLCGQPYRDPRLLPCLHAFCFHCLQKQLDDSTDQQASLVCPTCMEQVHFPSTIYLSTSTYATKRTPFVACWSSRRQENVKIVTVRRRRARSVPTVATAGFESANNACNSTESSPATRSTRSLV